MNYIDDRNQRFKDAGWLYRYDFKGAYQFDEIVKWCTAICKVGEDFTYAGPTFWFKKPEHYTWFVLRWS